MGVETRTERLLLRPLETAGAPHTRALCGDLAGSRWLACVPSSFPDGAVDRFIDISLADGALELDRSSSSIVEGKGATLRISGRPGLEVPGRRMLRCLARGTERTHIDTALPRADREARA